MGALPSDYTQRTQGHPKKAAGRRALRRATCLCDVPRGDLAGRETYRLYGVSSLAPRRWFVRSGARTPFRAPAGRVVSFSHPTLPRSPAGGCTSSSGLPGLFMRTCLCSLFAGDLLNASLFSRAHRSASSSFFFFFWILACLLPQRGKKKKVTICLEKNM